MDFYINNVLQVNAGLNNFKYIYIENFTHNAHSLEISKVIVCYIIQSPKIKMPEISIPHDRRNDDTLYLKALLHREDGPALVYKKMSDKGFYYFQGKFVVYM